MSDEDIVSLVVEGDHPPALELGHLGEPRRQHSGHRVTQMRGEVVENHLRLVVSHLSMTLHREKGDPSN